MSTPELVTQVRKALVRGHYVSVERGADGECVAVLDLPRLSAAVATASQLAVSDGIESGIDALLPQEGV